MIKNGTLGCILFNVFICLLYSFSLLSRVLSETLSPQVSAVMIGISTALVCAYLLPLTKRQAISITVIVTLISFVLINIPKLAGYCLIIYIAGYLAIYSIQKRKRKKTYYAYQTNQSRVKSSKAADGFRSL